MPPSVLWTHTWAEHHTYCRVQPIRETPHGYVGNIQGHEVNRKPSKRAQLYRRIRYTVTGESLALGGAAGFLEVPVHV